MIKISKSATEAPRFISAVSNRLKNAFKKEVREPGEANRPKPSEARRVARPDATRIATNAQKWNEEYVKTPQAQKFSYITEHLPKYIRVGSEAERVIAKALGRETLPFTSELFQLISKDLNPVQFTRYANQGVARDSAKILSDYPRAFSNIFKEYGTQNLTLKDPFQLKAIKFFSDRNSDLKNLQKDGKWQSIDELKKTIPRLQEEGKIRTERSKKVSTSKDRGEREEALREIKDLMLKYPDNSVIATIRNMKLNDNELIDYYDAIKEVAREV